jgi:DNA-binding FadR family transcriptional regulator
MRMDVLQRKGGQGPGAAIMGGLTIGAGGDELHRISACMLGASVPASLAHRAVIGMEMSLLRQGWPVGEALGALPDVRRQLGLGRPAFREAITILEARGLLDVRRGPGGGLFVGTPALEDVVGAVLMYLAVAGETSACIVEFRLVVWRMVVSAAIQRHVIPSSDPGERGFAVDLAERTGNPTMVLLVQLADLLMQTAACGDAPGSDIALDAAVRQRDLAAAHERLADMTGPVQKDAPVIALEFAERAFSLSGRKSAMALAARMTHELSDPVAAQEAEWQTAERLGYTDAVVRQARRILQDFGLVQCRQGRRGAELAPPTAPTGVIRLLAPCLMASALSPLDEREAISFLLSDAPVLAVRRGNVAGAVPMGRLSSSPGADAFEVLTVENLLLDMSGNPLLAIVVRSLGMASILAAGDPLPPMDMRMVNAINRRLIEAINAGDADTVNMLSNAKLEAMLRPAVDYCEAG